MKALFSAYTTENPRLTGFRKKTAGPNGVLPFVAATLLLALQGVFAGSISDNVYADVSGRVMAVRNGFFVYQEADSGFNHGFPSGYFAGPLANLDTMHVNTACIDDPSLSDLSGISSNPNQLDKTRGTVMQIIFRPQRPSRYVGLNIEEPQDWGVRHTGTGYNLQGATNLVFDVRSPTPGGIELQFGMGGGVAPFQTIAQSGSYSTVTLSLASLVSVSDLSDGHILFTVVAANPQTAKGGVILLSNIHFDPVPDTTGTAALGFPLATQTFGIIPRPRPPFPLDQTLRNVTTIYESGIATELLLASGSASDLAGAQLVADTFDYALGHDNLGDSLPAAPMLDGTGLHNGYSSGDIALYNNQLPPQPGKAGEVRLAGFTCAKSVSRTGYAVELDGATGGNNAFAIIALADAYQSFGDPRYLADAQSIGNWIYENLADTSATGYGGYFVGYGDHVAKHPKPLEKGKSTENNAEIFAAFTALAAIDTANAAEWTQRANAAGDFVIAMHDKTDGHFYAGTVPTRTEPDPVHGVIPVPSTARGHDEINKYDFLDTNTLATLAMAAAPRYTNDIDWHMPVQYALNNFVKSAVTETGSFQGFSLVHKPISDADGVAWEFTGQMVVAMNFVDALYSDSTFETPASFYLGQLANAQENAPFNDGFGLVAATVDKGDTLIPIDQSLNTPYQDIPERVGLAASIWAAFADLNINPMTLPP